MVTPEVLTNTNSAEIAVRGARDARIAATAKLHARMPGMIGRKLTGRGEPRRTISHGYYRNTTATALESIDRINRRHSAAAMSRPHGRSHRRLARSADRFPDNARPPRHTNRPAESGGCGSRSPWPDTGRRAWYVYAIFPCFLSSKGNRPRPGLFRLAARAERGHHAASRYSSNAPGSRAMSSSRCDTTTSPRAGTRTRLIVPAYSGESE